MEEFQIHSVGPDSRLRTTAIKAWFDEMVATNRLKVLTWEFKGGSLTSITKGELPLQERETEL